MVHFFRVQENTRYSLIKLEVLLSYYQWGLIIVECVFLSYGTFLYNLVSLEDWFYKFIINLFQHVSCIPHFKDFPPHLVEWVEFGSQSQTPPNKPQGPVLPPHLEAIVKGAPPPAPPVTSVVSAPPPSIAKPTSLPAGAGKKNYFISSVSLQLDYYN